MDVYHLLPRRREIYQIIKDHPGVSFDFISRRFVGINKKTLQYDVSQLLKSGLIKKLGVTRGVEYE
jgi:predicted transcriptional regulator